MLGEHEPMEVHSAFSSVFFEYRIVFNLNLNIELSSLLKYKSDQNNREHYQLEGSSLYVQILFVCHSVRHHISHLAPSNHPKIMSDPTYHIPLDLVHVWLYQEHVW